MWNHLTKRDTSIRTGHLNVEHFRGTEHNVQNFPEMLNISLEMLNISSEMLNISMEMLNISLEEC